MTKDPNKLNFKLKTPRGTFNIHTIFESEDEARSDGWGGCQK